MLPLPSAPTRPPFKTKVHVSTSEMDLGCHYTPCFVLLPSVATLSQPRLRCHSPPLPLISKLGWVSRLFTLNIPVMTVAARTRGKPPSGVIHSEQAGPGKRGKIRWSTKRLGSLYCRNFLLVSHAGLSAAPTTSQSCRGGCLDSVGPEL